MKNILIVTGANFGRGGVQAFLLKWFKSAPSDYEFTWYFPGKFLKEDLDYLKDFEPYKINMIDGNLWSVNEKNIFVRFEEDLNQLMTENKFDIVHINTGSIDYQYHAMKIAVANKIKIRIAHSHNTNNSKLSFHQNLKYNFMRWYLRKYATICTSCSTEAGIWLFGKKIESSKTLIITKNTINVSKFVYDEKIRAKHREELGVSNEVLLGCVGRMNYQKNQSFIIDVLKKLEQTEICVKLLIIGDGERKEELIRKAQELRYSDRVIFFGTTGYVNEYLQAMDIFVMPSCFEGFAIAAIEAQAAGLHCLFSDVFSRETFLTDRVQYLSIDNAQIWADKIIDIVKNGGLNNEGQRKMYSTSVINAGFDDKNMKNQISMLYGK